LGPVAPQQTAKSACIELWQQPFFFYKQEGMQFFFLKAFAIARVNTTRKARKISDNGFHCKF
jgi:hypothetical protein